MAFTNIEITGTFKGPNQEALNGRVKATLSTTAQNGTTTINPLPVTAEVKNGVLSMTLAANNDPSTLPVGTFYTFRVELQRMVPAYEFKAIVDHAAAESKVDISSLYEASGMIGAKVRPQLSVSPTLQELSEVFFELGLAEPVQKPFARVL